MAAFPLVLQSPYNTNCLFADLHAGIWWSSPMLILGGDYTHRFFARKEGI